ncbi:MAG: hypothetical protein GX112_07865 [Clostridiaceae bacterium]|jgi:hypothetical protein|nr:hypothetical protein [Clostridiaceae bacterium]
MRRVLAIALVSVILLVPGPSQAQTITRPALPLSSGGGLTLQLMVQPAIGYFAGQTNLLGDTIPLDPNRVLAGEKLWLTLTCSESIAGYTVQLGAYSWTFAGYPGYLTYMTGILVPDGLETLSWSGERLGPALTLSVTAWTSDNETSLKQGPVLEITGHVRQLVRTQPARAR